MNKEEKGQKNVDNKKYQLLVMLQTWGNCLSRHDFFIKWKAYLVMKIYIYESRILQELEKFV